jgi:hypothetical protein
VEERRRQKRECEARRRARWTPEERAAHNAAVAAKATPEHKVRRAQKQKNYYANLSEEQRKIRNEKAVLWQANNREKINASQIRFRNKQGPLPARAKNLATKYGITLVQFDELLLSQEGRCAICRSAVAMGPFGQWHIDHCHTSGKVRGILCFKCNVGLGKFNDDPKLLVLATKYLEACQ